MLILAFDTATDLATCALLSDGVSLGESTTRPQALLAEVDRILGAVGVSPAELTGIVVGTGPGSFTGTESASRSPAASRSHSIFRWPESRRSTRSPQPLRGRTP